VSAENKQVYRGYVEYVFLMAQRALSGYIIDGSIRGLEFWTFRGLK